MRTDLGDLTLTLRPDAAPVTVEYIKKCVASGLYNGREFYRSDFVIQCGLHGSSVQNPHGNLPVNETSSGAQITNGPGTCAIAHWDVPDCGNTEFFINLKANSHLDTAYGGYCVFAEVTPEGMRNVVPKIAAAVAGGQNTRIIEVQVVA